MVTLFENVRNKIGNGCQNAGAQAIVDYANETILMFPYASVEQHWRCLLMDGTLLLATEKFLQSPTDDLVREVIRIVDTGVVVSGAPGENRRAHADAILDALQTWLSDRHPVGPLPEPIVLSTPVPAIADKHAVPRWPAPPGFTAFSDTVANDAVPRILPQGVIDHWPARSHWPSLEYLLKLAGDRVVPVEIGSKYTDAAWQQKMICLREFVCDYVLKAEPAYLAQHDLFSQIPRLLSDIDVPEYCYCSPEPTEVYTPPDQELILNAWFGPQNTISPLHHDPYHNLLAQVVGRKYIRLYPPGAHVYPLDGIMANTSQVNMGTMHSLFFVC